MFVKKSQAQYLFFHYSDCNTMLVGTGDVPTSSVFIRNVDLQNHIGYKTFSQIPKRPLVI